MWKLISGISLALSMVAVADDTPPEPSVTVKCCGRLRHGVVAIGGETTGTTITFHRIVWELRLNDAAEREFAQEHNKESVLVTGSLRRIAGIEVKDRWIIDVKTLSECDAAKDREGTQLSIQGTLRATDRRTSSSPEMTIHAEGQSWPIDFSSEPKLKVRAESLVGQSVLLTGSLKEITEEEPDAPVIIRVKTLK